MDGPEERGGKTHKAIKRKSGVPGQLDEEDRHVWVVVARGGERDENATEAQEGADKEKEGHVGGAIPA